MGNCEEELPKKPVGRLSVNCRPTHYRQFTDRLPTAYRQATDKNDAKVVLLHKPIAFLTFSLPSLSLLLKVAHSNLKYPERYFENLRYITRSNTRIALIEAKVEMF